MSVKKTLLTVLFNTLSSSKLALVLVLLVILFALAGAVLPQAGTIEPDDITAWQQIHPVITAILKPVGLFNVFHSWPFLVSILLLGINTLTCTVPRFLRDGGSLGPGRLRKAGFLLLHLSIILLLVGGFISAAASLDGYIVLTEGQALKEQHDNYLRIVEGPLRRDRHEGFIIRLKDVQTEYQRKWYPTDITSNLEILYGQRKVADATVKVNKPFKHGQLTFTQDDTGFSPRLEIADKRSGRVLINSFVALKTFRTAQGREYRDFLPLSFLENKVIITLYPSFSEDDGDMIKTGENPDNPLLIVQTEDESGQIISRKYVQLNGKIELGKYNFSFTGLRRWSSFKVVADSGYVIVCVSLWLGLASLLLRYFPDILKWFREGPVCRPDAG
jgi:hypothetical protein